MRTSFKLFCGWYLVNVKAQFHQEMMMLGNLKRKLTWENKREMKAKKGIKKLS